MLSAGVTIQGAPPQVPPPPPSTDDASVAASAAKRRKKKRRRRRRRGGHAAGGEVSGLECGKHAAGGEVSGLECGKHAAGGEVSGLECGKHAAGGEAEDGSEESSSEEQIEEPRSLTSHGSSLQELDVSPGNCSTTATSNHHQTIISSSVEGTEDKSTSSSFSSSPPPPPPEQEELPSIHRDDTVHVVLVNGDLGPPLSDESTQTASLSSLSSSDGLEKNPKPHPDELRVIPSPSSEILVNGFHSGPGIEDHVDGKTDRQPSSRTTPSKDLHPSPSSLIEALNNAENKDRAVTKDIPDLQAKQGITKPESKNLCNGTVKQTVRNRKENRQKTNGSVNGTKLKTTGKMERNEPSAGGRNKGPPDQNVKQQQLNRPSTESSNNNPDSSPQEAKERAPRIPHDFAPGPRAYKVAEPPLLPHDKRGAKPARKERPNRVSPPNHPPAVPETAPLDHPDITSLSLRPEPPKNLKSPSYETSKPLKEISQKNPSIEDDLLKSLTEVNTPLTKESIKTPAVEAFVCETSRSISPLHPGEYVIPKEISSLKALTQDFISKEIHLPDPRHAGEEHLGDDPKVTDPPTDPPVPPPRRKRWRGPALRRSSIERAPTPGRELLEEGVEVLLTDESSLSSSSSSEESVIELLSSMPTSPDVEVKARSSEEEDYVIFKDNLPMKDKSGPDATVVTCAKIDDCDKSTSAHSTEVVPWEEGPDPRPEKQEGESSLSPTSVDRYSEVLSRLIASDALTEVTEERARSAYPITEAVTRWLRSQSPEEVLSLPPPESESDLTDDETQVEEETQGGEKKLTGPKNVYRNPLPAPSLKDDLHPLNGGLLRGAGTRVAKETGYTTNIDNKIGEEGRTNVPPSDDDEEARHVDMNEERNMSRGSSFVSDSTGEWDQWDIESTKPTVPQEGARLQSESPDDRRTYMCDPSLSVAKYYRLGAPATRKNEEGSSSETLSGSSSDEVDALRHFEYEMGDPERGSQMSLAVELARSLEPLPEHWAVDPIRSAGNPEVYKKRYGDSPGGCQVWLAESGDNRKQESIFQRQSEILMSRLKGEGPFPCGGICCILQ
uniref:Uncharacterized protein n=1 Tax=Timema genevievae TaxID=629358 RepID=A0A7R9K6W4_TIMGE|nr:unnamed protein product [Timema genevievae]